MISTAIITCSYDMNTLPHVIAHAKPFSEKISVCYTTHLWNGEEDHIEELEHYLDSEDKKQVIPVKVKFEEWMGKTHSLNGIEPLMRQASVNAVGTSDHCLLLDSDEVVDSDLFTEWINEDPNYAIRKNFPVRFACYYYFRSARYRQRDYGESGLLIPNYLFNKVQSLTGTLHIKSGFLNYPGYTTKITFREVPMIHHYGVHPKEEMLRKVRSWTHRNDFKNIDWTELMTEEFSHEFNGTDPYSELVGFGKQEYVEVEPFIDLGTY